MTDLVERLRSWNRGFPTAITPRMMMCEAAAEIERLRDDLEKTSALLKESYEITASQSQEIEKLRAQVISLQSSLDAGPPKPGKKTPDALGENR